MTIPERMKSRPTYGGLPVPFAVVIDHNGVPDFKITDVDRWHQCIREKLCAICGERLDYWVWYIGGESCAEQGIYLDLAMHEECAFYSARACPFLAEGRDYSEHVKAPAGYQATWKRHDVVKAAVLYASKRRRDQVEIVHNGSALAVKAGPEVERVQIYPEVKK